MAEASELRERLWRRCAAEERLLLACSRQHLTAEARAAVACAPLASLQWDVVLTTAVRHQVAPLVFENLARCGVVAALPAAVAAGFHHAVLRSIAASRERARALDAALDYFGARGIDVMLIKGTALDQRVFEHPWLTTSADVDLLLRPRWTEIPPDVKARIVALNAGAPPVDVHAERHPDLVMNGVLPLDFAAIWARALPAEVGGRRGWLMSSEDELLAVCINACRKRYFRLKSLCATAELLRLNPALDWDAFGRRARAWGCHRIALAALTACAVTVGCELPRGWRAPLAVPRARAALLDFLIARMSFGSLPEIHRHRRLLGKYLSRWLCLSYASLGFGQWLRSARVVAGQMWRRGR